MAVHCNKIENAARNGPWFFLCMAIVCFSFLRLGHVYLLVMGSGLSNSLMKSYWVEV